MTAGVFDPPEDEEDDDDDDDEDIVLLLGVFFITVPPDDEDELVELCDLQDLSQHFSVSDASMYVPVQTWPEPHISPASIWHVGVHERLSGGLIYSVPQRAPSSHVRVCLLFALHADHEPHVQFSRHTPIEKYFVARRLPACALDAEGNTS